MKNLITIGIDKLDILPIELLNYRPQTKHKRYYRRGHSDYHPIDGRDPDDIARGIIKKYLNRSYNDAYSLYCTRVKWYQKHIFRREFNLQQYWYYRPTYRVDDDGLIRLLKEPKKKEVFTFFSDDYKFEWRHKITGHKRDAFQEVYEQIEEPASKWYPRGRYRKGKFLYYEYGAYLNMKPIHERYRAQQNDFEAVTIQGWKKTFNSVNHPEYVRLWAERNKARRKMNRAKRKEKEQLEYSFISKQEIELAKEKEANKYKILAHGFDLITSFRNGNQTNPDLIKERQ